MRLLAEVTLTLVLFTDAARIDMTALRHRRVHCACWGSGFR